MLWLVRASDVDANVFGLFLGQFGEGAAECFDMDTRDLFVEDLGQTIDLLVVVGVVVEQFDLGDRLIREGGGHDEAGVAGGVAQVQQAAFGQDDDGGAVGKDELVDLWFDLHALDVVAVQQGVHVDFVVEMANVAEHGVVFHLQHLLECDDAQVAGGGDDDVGVGDSVIDVDDGEAVHECLEGVDGVCFSDLDAGALAGHGFGTALANIAVTADEDALAAHEHIGGAVDAVDEGVAGAVFVVELGLGDGVVDVHSGEGQGAFLSEVVEAVHAGGGFFGDAADGFCDATPAAGFAFEDLAQHAKEGDVFVGAIGGGLGYAAVVFVLAPADDGHGGIATVVEDHVGQDLVAFSICAPAKNLVEAPPILVEGFALPREDRHTIGLLDGAVTDDNCCGGLVLGGENVAGGPAHVCAQCGEGFDKYGRLDGHVDGACNTGTFERLLLGVFAAQLHEAWHFVFGEADLVPAGVSQAQVRDPKISEGVGVGAVLRTVGHRGLLRDWLWRL